MVFEWAMDTQVGTVLQTSSGASVIALCLAELTRTDSQFIYDEVCGAPLLCTFPTVTQASVLLLVVVATRC